MSKTIFSVFSLVIVAVLALSLASAFDFSLSTPASMSLTNNHTSSTISYSGSDSINVSFSLSTPSADFTMSTPASLTSFNGTKALSLNITGLPSTLKFDNSYPFTLTANAKNASNSTDTLSKSVSFNFVKTFCKYGAVGTNLSISNVAISTTGDKKQTWMPLDTITVEVEVRNEGESTMGSVYAEIGLFNSAGDNKITSMDFANSNDEERIEIGSISKDSKETATFEFTVPADFDTDSYKLAVKAYSTKATEAVECDDNSDDLESTTYETISVEKQTDDGKYIAFDKIKATPSEATCGDTVGLTFDTLNIGDVDQTRVKVKAYNKDLKLDTYSEIKSDLNSGDKKSTAFTFTVPAGLKDGTYNVELSAEYDYRSDTYRKQSDDVVKVPIKVIGCTPVSTKLSSISAVLSSDAVAGKEMTVTTTIRNIGADTNTFAVDATGYSSWATLSSISGNVLTLAPGDARDVIIKLNVNSDASGSKTFTVNAASGNNVESKDVTVNLAAKASGFSFDLSNGNNMLWLIGIVNLILIVIIIIVAVRVSRR